MPILVDPTQGGVGSICSCSQAEAEPTCELIAGPGIRIVEGAPGDPATIEALSADAWTSYTPAVTGFTLGNASNGSRYLLVGKTLDVLVAFKFGSTSSFTSTPWRVGLPGGVVPFYDTLFITGGHSRGWASLYDDSAANKFFQGQVFLDDGAANPMGVRFGSATSGTNTQVIDTVPFTWAQGDELVMRARFEVV